MARQPEPPTRPWWVVPALVVLAFFGVVFLIRVIVGFVAGILGLVVVVALIALGVYWFTKRE
jgi:hypothetical protein